MTIVPMTYASINIAMCAIVKRSCVYIYMYVSVKKWSKCSKQQRHQPTLLVFRCRGWCQFVLVPFDWDWCTVPVQCQNPINQVCQVDALIRCFWGPDQHLRAQVHLQDDLCILEPDAHLHPQAPPRGQLSGIGYGDPGGEFQSHPKRSQSLRPTPRAREASEQGGLGHPLQGDGAFLSHEDIHDQLPNWPWRSLWPGNAPSLWRGWPSLPCSGASPVHGAGQRLWRLSGWGWSSPPRSP